MTARERLDRALVDMASRGEKPRCAWPDRAHLWTSEEREERVRAVRGCAGCPILDPCGAAAEEERDVWTVRGGVDRRPSRTARAAKGATT